MEVYDAGKIRNIFHAVFYISTLFTQYKILTWFLVHYNQIICLLFLFNLLAKIIIKKSSLDEIALWPKLCTDER